MLSQCLNCVIAASQFGLGERRVDFAVADLVKKNGRAALASAQFRDQVVVTPSGIGRWQRGQMGAASMGRSLPGE